MVSVVERFMTEITPYFNIHMLYTLYVLFGSSSLLLMAWIWIKSVCVWYLKIFCSNSTWPPLEAKKKAASKEAGTDKAQEEGTDLSGDEAARGFNPQL